MHRTCSLECFLLACFLSSTFLPAISGRATVPSDRKRLYQYPGFVITGGLPASVTFPVNPDPEANHYDLSCNGPDSMRLTYPGTSLGPQLIWFPLRENVAWLELT